MEGQVHAMTALALGAVQGVTEFLPISSDGHLAVAAWLFGVRDMPLSWVVLLHAGTLIATFIVFGQDIVNALLDLGRRAQGAAASDRGSVKLVTAILVATLPTGIIGLALHDRVESWAHVPWIVGACFLITAVAVWTTRFSWSPETREYVGIKAALLIGVAQGLAVLPGVSRSGITIATAMWLGVRPQEAFRFSFLLSLPAIGGALLLELIRPKGILSLDSMAWLSAVTAGVIGYGALRALREIVARGRFWVFSVYLVPLGLGILAWDLWS